MHGGHCRRAEDVEQEVGAKQALLAVMPHACICWDRCLARIGLAEDMSE